MTVLAAAPSASCATPPTPGAIHDTRRIHRVATLLYPAGAPYRPAHKGLIPWQVGACRVISEHDPRGVGWRWPRVVVTVPRQSGKSVMVAALVVYRCIMMPGHHVYMTAQTGQKARELWLGVVEAMEHSPKIARTIRKVTKGAGDSKVLFRNGSLFAPFPPTSDGLDSKQCDTLVIDEAMAHSVEAGEALLGSAIPTQTSRPWRQTILISTRGGADAAWFRGIIAQAEEAGLIPESHTAIIEYASPDGADPNDPAIYPQFHPGVGYTTDVESIMGFREQMSAAEFKRAFGNRWDEADEDDHAAIPIASVNAVTAEWPASPAARVTIAFDIAADQSSATIAAGWIGDDGVPTAAVIAHQPGTSWLAQDLAALHAAGAPITADPAGPTAVWLDSAPDSLAVTRTSPAGYALACQTLHDRVLSGTCHLLPSDALTAALRAAVTRPLAGMTALDPRKSAEPIDAARAVALALHAAILRPRELQVF